MHVCMNNSRLLRSSCLKEFEYIRELIYKITIYNYCTFVHCIYQCIVRYIFCNNIYMFFG